MRIGRIEWYARELPRREPFATSQHVSDAASVVLVRLDADGVEGWGAASPSDVTGETLDTVVAALARLAADLQGFKLERGRDVADRMDAKVPGNPAAKAAIDMATFDALAKTRRQPLYKFLGPVREMAMTDRTVG